MNYIQFTTSMKKQLQKMLEAEAQVENISVEKNNGVVLQGITIKRKEDRVVPAIYLEKFYEDYLEGKRLEELAEEFLEAYQERDMQSGMDFSFFREYKNVRKRLAVKLIQKEKNSIFLKETPHVEFLDLAMVFYCSLEIVGAGCAAVTIKESHLNSWGITTEQLCQDALENAPKLLPGKIHTIDEVVRRLLEGAEEEEEKEEFPVLEGFEKEKDTRFPMLILTNTNQCFGASCIMYKGLLKRFADKIEDNLYILPSSVHEVILLPEGQTKKPNLLLQMVQEVNETQLEPEEVLADSVYYYDKEADEIRLFDTCR